MPLIFNDTLQARDCTGLYTLQALIGSTWTDIHTISGAQNGTIEVDAALNTIEVDTSLLIPGQTYDFKWVDSLGNESNMVSLAIPGSGPPAAFATITFLSIANGGLSVVLDCEGINNTSGDINLFLLNITTGQNEGMRLLGPGPFSEIIYEGDIPYIPGNQYQLILMDIVLNPALSISGPGNIYSNILTAP
jgi:hypothetical protein